MNIFLKKITYLIGRKIFLKSLIKKIYPYFKGFFLILLCKKNQIKIHVPASNISEPSDKELISRLFEFYKKMKLDQTKVNNYYNPSSMWQKFIDKEFSILNDSIKNNNINSFKFFLENFGNNKSYLGIENQDLIKKYNNKLLLKKFLSYEMLGGQHKLWNYFNNNSVNISEINMPKFGNQNGATINDNFFVLGSFFNHIYADIIANYFDPKKKEILVDLGGGYGKLAYYVLKKRNIVFIDFDIPETLVLAAYYLSKCFPEKKNFFYGESIFSSQSVYKFDMFFLPSWEIEKLEENQIQFTINKNSLGEMKPESAKNYLNHIFRISKYFFSMNHETFRNKFDDGTFSLINKEFHANGKFKQLIRYPDLSHLTYENNKLNLESDIFFYIYEKK